MQDLLWKHGSSVYKFITDEKGSVYICGGIVMAEGVENTLENILKQFGEMSDQDAINYIERMKV